jgi:hypothetical protein
MYLFIIYLLIFQAPQCMWCQVEDECASNASERMWKALLMTCYNPSVFLGGTEDNYKQSEPLDRFKPT